MREAIIRQGRLVSSFELAWLRGWLAERRWESRHRLALDLCRRWQWRTATGRLKNYAARSFLLKLERCGLIELPPVREAMRRGTWLSSDRWQAPVTHSADPITNPLGDLKPLSIVMPSMGSQEELRFRSHLVAHHYLGFGKTVGENLQYLVRDQQGRDLACLLFGSAAWKVETRDQWIGWNDLQRQRHLITITNNTRFLVLPWVRVPHLASHILSKVLHRLSSDWEEKYGHPVHLVETFVERDRFRGTCYRAANWIPVGKTTGRSRQDRDQTLSVPVKDVYLYPLHQRYREALC